MLSRRRSSEQIGMSRQLEEKDRDSTITSSPTLRRLNASLRHVNVLFSVIAHVQPDIHHQQQQHSNSQRTTHSTLQSPTTPLTDISSSSQSSPHQQPPHRRRLFSPRSSSPLTNTTLIEPQPIHRLVVAVSIKNNSSLRLYQVIDYGSVSRLSVVKIWNLSDLRRIDGLGMPVKDSLTFGLFLSSSSKILVWKTNTSSDRAKFLWSLLQTCASKLKRAPPVLGLKLLDLQTFVENPSSLIEQQHEDAEQEDADDADEEEDEDEEVRKERRAKNVQIEAQQNNQHDDDSSSSTYSASEQSNNIHNHIDGIHTDNKQIISSVIDPLAYVTTPTVSSSPTSPQQPSPTSFNHQKNYASSSSPHHIEQFSNVGRDLYKQQLDNNNRGNMNDEGIEINNAIDVGIGGDKELMTITERRMQEEMKMLKLSDDECDDLMYALEIFENESISNCSKEMSLNDFGTWTENEIQSLEVKNISDIVSSNNSEENENENEKAEINPYDILIDSLKELSPWLGKNENLLKPYAELIKIVNEDMKLLQVQRKNTENLQNNLNNFLNCFNYSKDEQQQNDGRLLNDLESNVIILQQNQQQHGKQEMNYKHIYKGMKIICKRLTSINSLLHLKMNSMIAIKNLKYRLLELRFKVSSAVLPCLCYFLDDQYNNSNGITKEEDIRLNIDCDEDIGNSNIFSEFMNGLKCLCMCGRISFMKLVDHYIHISSEWIVSVIRFSLDFFNENHDNDDDDDDDDDVEEGYVNRLMDFIFYACLSECFRAFRLFSPILTDDQFFTTKGNFVTCCHEDNGDINDNDVVKEVDVFRLGDMVRRQIPSVSFIEDCLKTISVKNDKINSATLHACLMLRMTSTIDDFSLQNFKDSSSSINDIVTRVESYLHLQQPSNSTFTYRRSKLDQTIRQATVKNTNVIDGYNFDKLELHRQNSLSTDNVIIKNHFLDEFINGCQYLSSGCYNVVNDYVMDVISILSVPRDVSTSIGRSSFFSRIVQSVDLCYQLAFTSFNRTSPNTKSLCDKLIAGAMRCTQVITSSPSNIGEIIKLQSYGYIATKLSQHPTTLTMLTQPSHLATRVCHHVMTKWVSKSIINQHLPSSNTLRHSLDAANTALCINKCIELAMESAYETCAVVTLYDEVVIGVKDKMEGLLKYARKNKSLSDLRPQLLAYSRELLAILRAELRVAQSRFKFSDDSSLSLITTSTK